MNLATTRQPDAKTSLACEACYPWARDTVVREEREIRGEAAVIQEGELDGGGFFVQSGTPQTGGERVEGYPVDVSMLPDECFKPGAKMGRLTRAKKCACGLPALWTVGGVPVCSTHMWKVLDMKN